MIDNLPPRLPAEESGPQWEAAGRDAQQLAARLQMAQNDKFMQAWSREQAIAAWQRAHPFRRRETPSAAELETWEKKQQAIAALKLSIFEKKQARHAALMAAQQELAQKKRAEKAARHKAQMAQQRKGRTP